MGNKDQVNDEEKENNCLDMTAFLSILNFICAVSSGEETNNSVFSKLGFQHLVKICFWCNKFVKRHKLKL